MKMVFVNPGSCGGKGIEKWEKVKPLLNGDIDTFMLQTYGAGIAVKEYYNRGIRNFIAAGGDGTVNLVLNQLINDLTNEQLTDISLGAIGTGSSNDFHKPFDGCSFFDDIPARINFDKAEARDVGCISYNENGIVKRKYFLINASIGITAEANNLFNNPDRILSNFKRRSTPLSIIYSALKTIFSYKNFPVVVCLGENIKFETDLTNLGIIKNPCFSGNLKYDCCPGYSSGYFDVFLCYKMSLIETFRLLRYLGNGKFSKINKKKHWRISEIGVSSPKSFYIEYDGEIIKTDNVSFTILPKLLKVCTC